MNESRMISREDGRNPAAVGGNINHTKVILCEGMYRMAFLLAQINFLIPSQFICNDFYDFFVLPVGLKSIAQTFVFTTAFLVAEYSASTWVPPAAKIK